MNGELQQGLGTALAALRAGRDGEAQAQLDALLARWPNDPDALQLSGMVKRKRGDQAGAIALFRRSLEIRPAQPHVHHSLGNAYLALGRKAEARAAYAEALRHAPDNLDARIALGECEFEDGEAKRGCATLRKAIKQAPENGRAWASYGRALRADARHEEAIEALLRAAQLRPGHVGTLYNLAVALRLGGRVDEARLLLEECLKRNPDLFEARYVLGHCQQELGEVEAAARTYRAAIAARPTARDAHDSLSRLLWQHGDAQGYLQSYGEVLSAMPDEAPLLADLAAKLGQAGRLDEAVQLLRESMARGVETPDIAFRLGQSLAARKDDWLAEAVAPLRSAAEATPVDHGARYELIRVLMELGRLDEAQQALAPLRSAKPADQQGVALQALIWRALGDARADPLLDTDALVWAGVLEPPPGYGDIAGFNRDLAAALDRYHRGQRHPIEQTLRGGTQTVGELLDRDEPAIRALRGMLARAVTAFIARMPDGADQPLFARKAHDFRFSGSWSVRLATQGYHLSHIHPSGWISSCYYVAVPESIAQGSDDAGCLVLGKSNLDLGPADRVLRTIRPQSGLLALFPSYMYHATVPFESETPRLTVAFDVVPS
ncbi:hypothetical protein B2G71_09700 [Novosphingobium sp. PC22D]|uniref:tetratricopeptide repeat protein n=1 Tax=Novosphingobium sp. PC22D TaxID=1962403 RepID=UPI000BEF83C8|nr:tetratricopeptide repeat protein [Novosphingobium sp. PC22D]PEQ13083.1 hypothetical protein B2G71_09700 [Novosphingobium sp. PC22D]